MDGICGLKCGRWCGCESGSGDGEGGGLGGGPLWLCGWGPLVLEPLLSETASSWCMAKNMII